MCIYIYICIHTHNIRHDVTSAKRGQMRWRPDELGDEQALHKQQQIRTVTKQPAPELESI